jgi:hypothetical protein
MTEKSTVRRTLHSSYDARKFPATQKILEVKKQK